MRINWQKIKKYNKILLLKHAGEIKNQDWYLTESSSGDRNEKERNV
jgi:hypothetical protein